jgi:anthranilate phosphoribosyltransferase
MSVPVTFGPFSPLLLKLMYTLGTFAPNDTKLSRRHLSRPGRDLPAQAGASLAAIQWSLIGHLLETLAAAAEVMREQAVIVLLADVDVLPVDILGSGGDGHCTFHVSKPVAMLAAGAGACVV